MAVIKNGTATVQKGDTLSAIAAKAGTTVSAIAKANNIANVNLIRPGQVFTLPGAKNTGGTTGKTTGGTTGGAVTDTTTTTGMTAEELQAMLDARAASDRAAADAINAANEKKRQVDSIAAISALLSSYGIGDLSTAITDAVIKGYSSDTIQLIMQDPKGTDPLAVAFQTRFPANKARLAAGKSVLSAAEYLAAERSYSQVLQSYGVASLATRDKMNAFITNDISAAEVSDRVGLAITRVKNADADTKAALALYYPMLNQADIVGAVLDPAEGLPALQRKVQMAEIGGAGLVQGMNVAQSTAADLADYGVTKDEARKGYATVAELTPRADFLSQISQGENYGIFHAFSQFIKGEQQSERVTGLFSTRGIICK
jgi:murein DD-endopeptidase MepM/ murein hydrolase activator NlpD